jgi:hypothetical protein
VEAVNGSSFAAAAQGTQYLYLNLPGFGGPNPSSAISNPTLIGSAALGTYTLTVAGGKRLNGATTDGSYLIELLAGASVIGSQTVVNPLSAYVAGTWNDITATAILTAGSGALGQDLAIRLSAFNNGSGGTQGQFDNVRLDFEAAAVPEPTTSLLIGTGVLGLIAVRRQRRK